VSPPDRYEALAAEVRREFPRFRIVIKARSPLHRAIDRVLRIGSFGQIDSYLDGYHTTLGQTVYVTADWDERGADARWEVLRHERVHMRQFRRWTPIGMAIAYLLLPLPVGLAWCRARLEMAAYAESIRAAFELHGGERVADAGFRARIVEQFTGAAYGWMWPFRRSVERWYDGVVATLKPSTSTGTKPGDCM
jgi:hypothetical protein